MERTWNLTFAAMHKINREESSVEMVEINNDDVYQYVSGLMKDIFDNANYKHYKIRSETTEVVHLVNKGVDELVLSDEEKTNIASRYLRAEIMGNERASRLNNSVKKGFLIQALIELDEGPCFFLSKVEINDYLDSAEMLRRNGLPYEDKALKTCIFVYNESKQISDILVTDKQKAVYWHSEFLELEACSDNETCTLNLFSTIERKIKNGTKKSNADYFSLRNALVVYFQTPKLFEYDNMIDMIFGSYQPADEDNVDIKKIQDAIKTEIEKKKFDTEFSIIPSVVKKKFKKSIKVNSFVNLQIDGADENYSSMITAIEEDEKKFLKIEADEDAFNTFKRD